MKAVLGLPHGESRPEPAASRSRSLSAKVRRAALWVAGGNVLLQLASIVVSAVVARILSPRDFGTFAVALTAYVIASSIGQLGMTSCLARADVDIDRLAPTALAVSVLSNTVLGGVMAAFATPIATALGSAEAATAIRIMSLAMPLAGVVALLQAQFVREFIQSKVFFASVAGFVLSTVVLLALARSGSGATAFAYSRLVNQLVMGCVLVALAPRRYRPRLARSSLTLIIKFGIPLAGANFINCILLNVDYMLLGHLMGAVELGVYVLAFNATSSLYGFLGTVINSVSLPAFSRVKGDVAQLTSAIAAGLRGVSLIMMPICALTLALARPAVLVLYGTRWAPSADPLAILSIYGITSTICLLFANVMVSLGRTRLLLALQIVWIGLLVPAMAIGVRQRGITGAAYAHVAVVVPVILPSYLLALRRATGGRVMALGKAVLPALLASSAAFAGARGASAAFQDPAGQLVAGLAAGGLIYLLCAGRKVMLLLGWRDLRHLPSPVVTTRGQQAGHSKMNEAEPAGGEVTEIPRKYAVANHEPKPRTHGRSAQDWELARHDGDDQGQAAEGSH